MERPPESPRKEERIRRAKGKLIWLGLFVAIGVATAFGIFALIVTSHLTECFADFPSTERAKSVAPCRERPAFN